MNEFHGIPVRINPYIPKGEVWFVMKGKKKTVFAHEGPSTGQSVEEWLQTPMVVKLVNLGEEKSWHLKPPRFFMKPKPWINSYVNMEQNSKS